MTPFHDDGQARFYLGDVRAVLRELPAASVHVCVTSPPYWGLRDYGTATWDGGDPECDHLGEPFRTKAKLNENWGEGFSDVKNAEGRQPFKVNCGKCGARRIDDQLGLEATPEAFVAAMVDVFREVRRVLRDDGTCWINIGDSYAANWSSMRAEGGGGFKNEARDRTKYPPPGLKPKDLVGIPWMLAFALRADGWYLRQDIIWAKPNPMPESVTDRCTKSHEYLFLLSKSARYAYDADAIREPHTEPWRGQGEHESSTPHSGRIDGGEQAAFTVSKREYNPAGRNKRSVWTIATAPYADAHFATFPQALVRPCILAGTSEHGCCAECGAPWERVTEHVVGRSSDGPKTEAAAAARGGRGATSTVGQSGGGRTDGWSTTTGWRASCPHDAVVVPCTVLDPFLGSGTTALVAKALGRGAIGIDLSAEYLEMAKRRCAQMALMDAEVLAL